MRIFTVDEVGFRLSGHAKSVLMKRGMKLPQFLIGGSGRENITVQVCCSASGWLLPLYTVFTRHRLQYNSTCGGPLGARYSVSANGWMTGPIFLDWMRSLFLPSLPQDHPPVLLVLDGHTSHISYEVQCLARENHVHLLKLPPHLTHLLQPLHLSVFKPMKSTWDLAVADFVCRERRTITRCDFPSLLIIIWEKGFRVQNAVGGFRRAEISPYNHTVVPQSPPHYSEPFQHSCSSHTLSPVFESRVQKETDSNKEGKSLDSQLYLSTNIEAIASSPQLNASTVTHSIPPVSQWNSEQEDTNNSEPKSLVAQLCLSTEQEIVVSHPQLAAPEVANSTSLHPLNHTLGEKHQQLRDFFAELLKSTQASFHQRSSCRYGLPGTI